MWRWMSICNPMFLVKGYVVFYDECKTIAHHVGSYKRSFICKYVEGKLPWKYIMPHEFNENCSNEYSRYRWNLCFIRHNCIHGLQITYAYVTSFIQWHHWGKIRKARVFFFKSSIAQNRSIAIHKSMYKSNVRVFFLLEPSSF